MSSMDWVACSRMVDKLGGRLEPKRFHHSLGAMHMAVSLASVHGGDVLRCAVAGLLHDCGKELSLDEVGEVARRCADVDSVDFEFPALLHAPAGAVLAREIYGVTDPEVLDIIRLHPIGRAKPSTTLRICMASDYVEPTRIFHGVEDIRAALRSDLRNGLLQMFHAKHHYVVHRGKRLHPRAFDMMRSLEGELT